MSSFEFGDTTTGVLPATPLEELTGPTDEQMREMEESERTEDDTRANGRVLMDLAAEEGDWQDDANCLGVDPDLFFPERGASTREAKEVCRSCVVRLDCLEFALANGEKFGIWGGLSERERRRIRRQRAQERRSVTA